MTPAKLAEAYIAEKTLEGIRDYLIRGRRFASLAEEALNVQWVEVYRAACGFDDENRWNELMDLQCEFNLRDIKPAMHALTAGVALFKARLEQLERDGRPDPAAMEVAAMELAELRARLRGPKN